MQRDVESVEQVVLQMTDRLAQLEERVVALEAATFSRLDATSEVETTPAGSAVAPEDDVAASPRPDHVGVLALCGRTFLILGGAYLLRALTQGGTLSSGVGVSLALVYAGAWFVAADRSSRRGRRLAAQLYGVTAALVAFPVVIEGVERFAIFGGPGALATLGLVTAIGFAVSLRTRLESVLWASTVGSLGVSLWVFLRASSHAPAAGFAVAVGIAAAVIALTHGWIGPRWPAALVADLMVLVLVQVASAPGGAPAAYADVSPIAAVGLAAVLVASYLTVVAVSTLAASGVVSLFDAVQVPVALVIGVGGIAAVVRATALGGWIVGGVCVALGFACYGLAFVFVDRRLGRNRTFFFYTSLGLLLLLAGVLLPASRGAAALAWSLVGLVMAAVGGAWNRITLRVHAAVFLCGAAIVVGLPAGIVAAFQGQGAGGSWVVGPDGAVLLMLIVGYSILAVTDLGRELRWNGRLPRLAVLLPSVAGAGAAAIAAIASLFPGGPPSPAAMAGIRSVVLAAAAVVLAAGARRPAVRELGWLVYPVLLIGGVRILLVDLRIGNPFELVVAFGAFGVALILAPGLLRRAGSGTSAQVADAPLVGPSEEPQ